MTSRNLWRTTLRVALASVAAILSYCVLTVTLSPMWVLSVVLPVGLVWSLLVALPTYIFLRQTGNVQWLHLVGCAVALCAITALLLFTVFDANTLLAFMMPLSASWVLSMPLLVVYWLVAVIASCVIGASVLKKLELGRSER